MLGSRRGRRLVAAALTASTLTPAWCRPGRGCVSSILSWFLCPFVAAFVGFFLGLSAKRDVARTGQAGGGMATAGMVIGAAHFAIYGLVLVVVLLVTAGICAAFMGSCSH